MHWGKLLFDQGGVCLPSDHVAPRSGRRRQQAVQAAGCASPPAKRCRCKSMKPTPPEQVHLMHPSELKNASACGFNKYHEKSSQHLIFWKCSLSVGPLHLPPGESNWVLFRHRNVIQKYRHKNHLGEYQGVLLNIALLFHCLCRTPHWQAWCTAGRLLKSLCMQRKQCNFCNYNSKKKKKKGPL